MQLTKEELVKFRAWRNERRKFWAGILFWVVWGGSSLVIYVLLGNLIPEEALPRWMEYAATSLLFFILAGTIVGCMWTIRTAKNKKDAKTQDRKGSEAEKKK